MAKSAKESISVMLRDNGISMSPDEAITQMKGYWNNVEFFNSIEQLDATAPSYEKMLYEIAALFLPIWIKEWFQHKYAHQFLGRKVVTEKQDMTFLFWSRSRKSSGTAGTFLKAYSELGGRKKYYKLSNYDSKVGIVGHECVNEIIVDRLLSILGIEHLQYQLIHADINLNGKVEDVYLCASEDFKNPGEDKVALDEFFAVEHLPSENELDFCIRKGWGDYVYKMLVVDFLILNRDRHGANIEVLRDKMTKSVRLAPLFDHGLSLLFNCQTDEEVDSFDVLGDKQVQAYVGSRSTLANLELIPKEKMPSIHKLRREDKDIILAGLESVVSTKLLEKIWDMIWKRWCYFEDFCNSR